MTIHRFTLGDDVGSKNARRLHPRHINRLFTEKTVNRRLHRTPELNLIAVFTKHIGTGSNGQYQLMSQGRIVVLVFLSFFCSGATFTVLYNMESIVLAGWYAIIGVAIGLAIGYTILAKIAFKRGLIRSRLTALILITLALPVFGYAFLGLTIPQINSFKSLDVEMSCPDGTAVAFSISFNFSTVGTFSAENPVHLSTLINHVNISDFTTHVGAITLTNAFNTNEQHVFGNIPAFGFISLKQANDGDYVAEGDFIWHQSETCYIMPIPPFQGALKFNETNVKQLVGQPVLYISPVSDTLSLRSNYTMEKLTYSFLGFSIIMLQPVINVLFPDPLARQRNPENSAQGGTSQKHNQKKH